jgi:hypothetical protein
MRSSQLAPNIVKTKEVGRHRDGAGLFLDVSPAASNGEFTRSWTLRYWLDKRERYMGLGSARDVSLAEAREKRKAARKLLAAGQDPIEERDTERA